jgi:hypothetical protein
MLVTFVAGLIAAAGAFLNFQVSGGQLSDLTDMNKLKASFSGSSNDDGGDMLPPPPAIQRHTPAPAAACPVTPHPRSENRKRREVDAQ